MSKQKAKLSNSSREWVRMHNNDPFVKQARKDGYLSRAVYKLSEIDAKHSIIAGAKTIVELGSAPGGWTQWLSENSDDDASIIALDLLPTASFVKVTSLQGDFTDEKIYRSVLELAGAQVDLIVSDISANHTGIKTVDIARNMYLCELCFELANQLLRTDGHLLVKIFQGSGFDNIMQSFRQTYSKVSTIKPVASKAKSREMYILGRFKKPTQE